MLMYGVPKYVFEIYKHPRTLLYSWFPTVKSLLTYRSFRQPVGCMASVILIGFFEMGILVVKCYPLESLSRDKSSLCLGRSLFPEGKNLAIHLSNRRNYLVRVMAWLHCLMVQGYIMSTQPQYALC